MPIRTYKPTTPSLRNMSRDTFEHITKTKPEKSLTVSKKSMAGRNNQGKLTVRHRGGGHKRKYRLVDFKRTDKLGIPATVKAVEYDPNRSAYIILVAYKDGEKRYHIAPHEIQVGDEIVCAKKAKIKTGNRMELRNVPVGYPIFNIELQPNKGGQIVKSAGNSSKVVSLDGPKAQIELPSGEVRLVEKSCMATIGVVSNIDHSNIKIGKAGRKRWMGKRPQVRGKAMNPNDHPHGGGEGASPIGMKHPKTPWGRPALGVKTRRRKYTNRLIVKSRHSKK
ncbi:50S ribosomal protein L2 [bacterium]|jgi:large subunit ribosomal protein L2|nr:50S ribosomal protein L2 [bacterium]MBT6293607.1 50S ribosomal protein L2 [bacterium]